MHLFKIFSFLNFNSPFILFNWTLFIINYLFVSQIASRKKTASIVEFYGWESIVARFILFISDPDPLIPDPFIPDSQDQEEKLSKADLKDEKIVSFVGAEGLYVVYNNC